MYNQLPCRLLFVIMTLSFKTGLLFEIHRTLYLTPHPCIYWSYNACVCCIGVNGHALILTLKPSIPLSTGLIILWFRYLFQIRIIILIIPVPVSRIKIFRVFFLILITEHLNKPLLWVLLLLLLVIRPWAVACSPLNHHTS